MKLTKRIERVLISFCFFFFFLRIFDAFIIFFFFSSRRRHTRLTCDWSSDVCSSDLALGTVVAVHNFGAGDLIEVKLDGVSKTELLPFDTAHVPAVEIAAGKIVVVPSPLSGED